MARWTPPSGAYRRPLCRGTAGTLLVPDYVGNSMYNSLGNVEVNLAAGLLFLDAAGGRTV